MEKKNVIEMAVYDREHLSHNMFAQMDWERDSIMRELDGAAVPQLPAAKKMRRGWFLNGGGGDDR